MCCGTVQNSYHTLAGMRLVLADGRVLDSEDRFSVTRFSSKAATTRSTVTPAPAPCTLLLIQDGLDSRLKLHDLVKFIREQLLDRLNITPQNKPVAVHVTAALSIWAKRRA
jgi:hypothetical protein